MAVRLYAIPGSHPAYAAELMLRHKGIAYTRTDLPQWLHRGMLRFLRFRRATSATPPRSRGSSPFAANRSMPARMSPLSRVRA